MTCYQNPGPGHYKLLSSSFIECAQEQFKKPPKYSQCIPFSDSTSRHEERGRGKHCQVQNNYAEVQFCSSRYSYVGKKLEDAVNPVTNCISVLSLLQPQLGGTLPSPGLELSSDQGKSELNKLLDNKVFCMKTKYITK